MSRDRRIVDRGYKSERGQLADAWNRHEPAAGRRGSWHAERPELDESRGDVQALVSRSTRCRHGVRCVQFIAGSLSRSRFCGSGLSGLFRGTAAHTDLAGADALNR
jgi:hypothetical protein